MILYIYLGKFRGIFLYTYHGIIRGIILYKYNYIRKSNDLHNQKHKIYYMFPYMSSDSLNDSYSYMNLAFALNSFYHLSWMNTYNLQHIRQHK